MGVKRHAILPEPLLKHLRGEGEKNTKLIIFNKNEIMAFKKLQNTCARTLKEQNQILTNIYLTTDASESGIAAILSQQKPNVKVVMI
jgi:hypothetical protein